MEELSVINKYNSFASDGKFITPLVDVSLYFQLKLLFRKTTASNIVKRGGSIHDASEYLGHKDRSTTGRYYTYLSEDHTIEIFNKYVASV